MGPSYIIEIRVSNEKYKQKKSMDTIFLYIWYTQKVVYEGQDLFLICITFTLNTVCKPKFIELFRFTL